MASPLIVRWLMGLAHKNDRLVDVHCDEIDDPESRALELITDNGAAALNLKEYGIAKGLPARCIVLQGQTPYDVLLGQRPVRDGRVLVRREPAGGD